MNPSSPPSPPGDDLVDQVLAAARAGGAVAAGVCGVEPLEEAREVIERRRAAGLHDGMSFTYRNPRRSTDPRTALPSALSAVVVAQPYRVQRDTVPTGAESPGGAGVVARYAAEDAYAALRRTLASVARVLADRGHRSVAVADDNALVDRAMALRAGLGWQGRSSNLLVPEVGSWVVLGSVLTEVDLTDGGRRTAEGVPDGCGTCRRCLDGCPTGALRGAGVLDAARCLSWLLQKEGDFPREHRAALGGRVYGCDDCQEVCPPNRRAPVLEPSGDGTGEGVDLAWMLSAADEELLGSLGAWYVPRRDPRYLRRNALVALGNVGDPARPWVSEVLGRHLRGGDALLEGHAAWAARRLGLDALVSEPGTRERPEVRAELDLPHPGTPGSGPGGVEVPVGPPTRKTGPP